MILAVTNIHTRFYIKIHEYPSTPDTRSSPTVIRPKYESVRLSKMNKN